MRAIILAAGRGSRMNQLTQEKPKCLVKLNGHSLLSGQIQAIKRAGIREIGIVTGYKHQMLAEFGLNEFRNTRWQRTNMVYSLSCAKKWLSETPCIISYSDIFYESSAIQMLMETNAPIAISYDPNWLTLWNGRFDNPLDDAETFRIDGEANLIEIGLRTSSVESIQGQYMGLLRFTPQSWLKVYDYLCSLEQCDFDRLDMTSLLNSLIRQHLTIKTLKYDGDWGEVDSESDLHFYESLCNRTKLNAYLKV
jgi:L-glutamine-phosphate cytidylyltransferase